MPLISVPPASAAGLTTFTTPLPLTFAQTFTTQLHLDIPPSPFTFYPNGTVRLGTSAPYLKWTFAVIPLQAPTSFQANNTYVVYSARGPASCAVSFAYKQSGNLAIVNIFGTPANPCASSTFSIQLKAYGGSLQATNSTGGISGTICTVQIGAITWTWCNAVLTAASISYNAGTIQFRNTASTFSIIDPLGLDGKNGCNAAATTCSLAITTANTNDVIECVGENSNAGTTSVFADAGSAGLTFNTRVARVHAGANSLWGYLAYTTSTATLSSESISYTSASAASVSAICFGVSGASIGSPFDPAGDVPDVTQSTANSAPSISTFSTTNANDFIVSSVAEGGTGQSGVPSGFSVICNAVTTCPTSQGSRTAAAYEVVSSPLSSVTITWPTSIASGWVIFVDAITATQNFVFTLSETVSASPSVANKVMHQLSDTVSITPSIQKIGKELVAAAVSLTPSVSVANMKLVSPVVTVNAAIACILNGFNCPTTTSQIIVGPNIDWIIVVPFVMVILLALLAKRRR